MKIIYNKLIPFKGFIAINLFGILFARNEYKNRLTHLTITHETIHTEQILDFVFGCKALQLIGGIIFYILYLTEWLIKLIISAFTFGKVRAYRSISFEQEAFNNQREKNYPTTRKRFAWLKYIFRLVWN